MSLQKIQSSKQKQRVSKIIGIQFSQLSPEEIRKTSVLHVTSRETYQNQKPKIDGLSDPRMGVLEPGLICPTDKLTYIDNPGYFGHIELAVAMFWFQHIKEIVKVLKCVCYKCSKLLINKKEYKFILGDAEKCIPCWTPSQRWEYVSDKLTKTKRVHRCGDNTEGGCGYKQPDTIKLENGMASIYGTWVLKGATHKTKITPQKVLSIFKRITDEDIYFMGFSPTWSRPEWMICTVLPVAPPAVRPSVKHDAQQRSEDDLTYIYSCIIKTNDELRDKIEKNGNINAIENLTVMLQYYILMLATNKAKGADSMAQRSGRPLQCISSRINGKTGRIRGNLMGKRVDYSARSVITGDPNLSIRELGVPLQIAKEITRPIDVNDRNRAFLMQLCKNGPDKHPGAVSIVNKHGLTIHLRNVDIEAITLHNGDIVNRHLMDGDVVLFNRQPSLHRMSMMGHVARIMYYGESFRLNVGVTKPYNADFDGDEMNMHCPQSEIAEIELSILTEIPMQIISPSSNAPIIGIFQDSMLGSFRFTRPDIKFSLLETMNLLMKFPYINMNALHELYKEKKHISSFDILSQILPPLTLQFKNKLFNDDKENAKISNNVLEIRNGKMVRGQLDSSCLASNTKGILHRICNDFGHHACADFIDAIQFIVTEYMKSSSYSVGISDLIADIQTQTQINKIISNKKHEVDEIIQKIHLGILENDSPYSNAVDFEIKVNNKLNDALNDSGKIGRNSLSPSNRFLQIINSGSKGSMANIANMIACLGQQNVDGKRIPYGFEGRTLPHYSKYDDTASARGFVENSYISGLNPHELFFHAEGGRVGLIDTACKTSKTGYIQRRLIKGMEDGKVEYDMTVRNNYGKIIQFRYGEDGMDSIRVENQFVSLVEMSVEDIYLHYDMIGVQSPIAIPASASASASAPHQQTPASVYQRDVQTRLKNQISETQEKCLFYIKMMCQKRDDLVKYVFKFKNNNMVSLPVGFTHIIQNIQGQLQLTPHSVIDITPLEMFQLIEDAFRKLERSLGVLKPNDLFKTLYFFYLTPRELIARRFHKKAVILLLETIIMKYKQSIVHPGEMVGVIAGQSIGEPTTQMTLNTFHFIGQASKANVTRGVPRIEEIIKLTKNQKSSSLTVFLKPQDEHSQEKATKYANMITHMKLRDVVKRAQILFDPTDTTALSSPEDKLIIDQYNEFQNIWKNCVGDGDGDGVGGETQSKWIIRLEMDAEIMLDMNITMDDIYFVMNSDKTKFQMECLFSDYNHKNLVFRIRTNASLFTESKTTDKAPADDILILKNFQDKLLNSIILRGIDKITHTIPRKLIDHVVMKDGKYKKEDVWVLDTVGTNLLEMLGSDYIDVNRTYSNNIMEIHKVLGIEATRMAINNEIMEVLGASGASVNYHHLSLLADRMTYTQNLVPIFRSGILNDNIGPVAKSTFEVHTEVLLDASRHAEFDHMRGVSANVMCGQEGYYGTSMCQLLLDIPAIKRLNDANIEEERDITTEITELFGALGVKDKVGAEFQCAISDLKIRNNISHLETAQPIGGVNRGLLEDEYELF